MSIPVQHNFIRWVWLISSAVIFGILLQLAFYNCPQSDDFFYGMWMQQWGFADANITIYYAWGGRYFSNILLTLCNGLGYSSDYKEFLIPYQWHSVLHIILFVISTLILFRRITFIQDRWIAAVPLLFFIKDAASISEFFYWLAGTATYCSGYIFGALAMACAIDFYRLMEQKANFIPHQRDLWIVLLIFLTGPAIVALVGVKSLIGFLNETPLFSLGIMGLITALVFILTSSNSWKKPYLVIVCLIFCSLASAGSSELAGALLVICFFLTWLWYFSKKNLFNPFHHLPIIIAVVALAFNVLAPATANREGTVNPELVNNWANSVKGTTSIFLKILHTAPLFLAGLILSILTIKDESLSRKYYLRHVLFFAGFQLLANVILPFSTLLKAGELPSRAVNIHQLLMYVSVFLLAYHSGLYLRNTFSLPFGRILLLVNLLMPLFLWYTGSPNNLTEAVKDLSEGRAQGFFEEFCSEQEKIKECKEAICEVEPLKSKPYCISSMSNAVVRGVDPPAWIRYKDDSYSAFYSKKHIFRNSGERK